MVLDICCACKINSWNHFPDIERTRTYEAMYGALYTDNQIRRVSSIGMMRLKGSDSRGSQGTKNTSISQNAKTVLIIHRPRDSARRQSQNSLPMINHYFASDMYSWNTSYISREDYFPVGMDTNL